MIFNYLTAFSILIINPTFIYLPLIFLLMLYIAYLQYQLSKNRDLYNSFLNKVLHFEKYGSREEIKNLIKKLAIFNFDFLLPKDKILDDKILNYVFENEDKTVLFLHYTKDLDVTENILKEGFKFKNSFYKTAESIYQDKIDFVYKHSRHKQFGKYAVIISISKKIYYRYSEEINKLTNSDLLVENILTETKPLIDENEDRIYTLPPQFIKGFINYEEGKIFNNPAFNYEYDSVKFKENIQASNK